MITVALTLGRGSLPGLDRVLREDGFAVREAPLLSFEPPRSWAPFESAMVHLDRYAAIALTSPRAARALRSHGSALLQRDEWLSRLWVVGPGTAGALGSDAVRAAQAVARRAGESAGAALARTMLEAGVGSPVLYLHGDVHRDEFSNRLRAAGVAVEGVEVYRSLLATPAAARRAARKASAIVVGSPRVMALLAVSIPLSERPALIALGPTTAGEAERCGWRVSEVAPRPSVAEVGEAVRRGTRVSSSAAGSQGGLNLSMSYGEQSCIGIPIRGR